MKIFEFQFNPKAKNDRHFRTFSLEKAYTGKGFTTNLYLIAELGNALPQNSGLLDSIMHTLTEQYRVQEKGILNPEVPFKKALRQLNAFLLNESKAENVDWLGNLHLALLAFSFFAKERKVTFALAKSGNAKVFLARKGQLGVVAKDKTLESLVSGKLNPADKLIVATPELSEFLHTRDLLRDLAFLKEEKQYQGLFKQKEKELLKVAGILFVGVVEELAPLARPKRNLSALTFFTPSAKKKLLLIALLYLVLMAGSLLFKT